MFPSFLAFFLVFRALRYFHHFFFCCFHLNSEASQYACHIHRSVSWKNVLSLSLQSPAIPLPPSSQGCCRGLKLLPEKMRCVFSAPVAATDGEVKAAGDREAGGLGPLSAVT